MLRFKVMHLGVSLTRGGCGELMVPPTGLVQGLAL